jgi:DNA-binding IclR family transcriptional regulator
MEPRSKEKPQTDGTVGKALSVLDQVAAFERPVRFRELLDASPFPKATLYRLLQTLTHQGMLSFDDDRQTYTPGMRLVRLAHTAWQQSSLAPIARPHVDNLANQVREAVHLAQLDHGHVLFVDKRKTTNVFDTLAQTGKVAPSYCTGVGKAILAFMPEDLRGRALSQQGFLKYTDATHETAESLAPELEEIRRNGVAFDREEHESGIISIAAPILCRDTNVIGAISIATSTSRRSLDELKTLQPALLAAAGHISAEAADWQFPSYAQ